MAELPPSWRDHRDEPVDVAAPPGPDEQPFYEPIGDFQGELYRRNAFAMATRAEGAALRDRLGLEAGTRVLDVGCGDGRHLRWLATDTGVTGVGVDISQGLVDAANDAAEADGVADQVRFVKGDARRLGDLPDVEGGFDVVTSVCQGGFGTSPATDIDVLRGVVAATRPGGLVLFTAFHALFGARHLAPGDAFDPVHLVHHQTSEVRGPDHATRRFDLWTAAYTVRDAVRLAEDAGLEVVEVVGAEPGRYDGRAVRLDDPELLVVGRA